MDSNLQNEYKTTLYSKQKMKIYISHYLISDPGEGACLRVWRSAEDC